MEIAANDEFWLGVLATYTAHHFAARRSVYDVCH
jgi:hypothetical protein